MKLHDDVHNYYEKMMLEELEKQQLHQVYDEDVMADFCCTVLNQLPARYIRFDVDMAFYLSSTERLEMQQRIVDAIEVARALIAKRGTSSETR